MPLNTQEFGNSQAFSETNQRDNGSVTHREDERIQVSEVQKYLQGLNFPANKDDLVEYATEREAPRRIVNLLQQLQTPEFGSPNATKSTVYNSFDELAREIGKIE
jgi:hypothetical protein